MTDVVDSTALSARLGDEAAAKAWAAHDRVARDLLRKWRGREIDKSDGLLLLFDSAVDAAGYALAYHEALSKLEVPLTARAGLHVGPVILRENSPSDVALGAKPLEVDGIAKPTAARVMALALGGQTLLTASARDALGPTHLRVQSHGYWMMKGIVEPLELCEVGAAGAPFTPPPEGDKGYRVVRQGDLWLPVRNIRQNLPAERDAFVGRRQTLGELGERLEAGARLVSIIGIGGTGKTRFITRFAWSRLGEFPGGAWFCDLTAARSKDGIVHAMAAALEVPLGKEDPVVQLGQAIAGRGRCLLILDNFEQVARYARDTLAQWLNRASAARFVVTTREVLGLPGEQVLALPPLDSEDALALFLQRCAAAKSDFRCAPDDEAAAAQLVTLLDGLPLAIELAAARVRVMPPRMMLARMGDRFRLLSSSGQRADRQTTLRATFDWSWDLLSAADKAALAQLSVFEGGFTLEAAEAVLDLSACASDVWAPDAVQSLADKSFVRKVSDERFDLLVSVQEYAAEHLRAEDRFPGSGPSGLAETQARHVAYFAAFSARHSITTHLAESDNLVAACRRAIGQSSADHIAATLEGAWAVLELRGPMSAGVDLATLALAVPALTPGARARIERIAGNALRACGKLEDAGAHFDSALALARQIGDTRCEAKALCDLGYLNLRKGHLDEAHTLFERALARVPQPTDPAFTSTVKNHLATVLQAQGRMESARENFEAAAAIARQLGDRRREGRILANIGVIHFEQGRIDEGRALYEQALAMSREVGDRAWQGNMLCNLGLVHELEGKHVEARAALEEALELARQMGSPHLECIVRCNLGIVFASLGLLDEAQSHYLRALAIARSLGDKRTEGQTLGYLALVHARGARFAEARECLEEGESLLRAMSDRFSLAILKCCQAEAEYLGGTPSASEAALKEAQALASALHAGAKSELGLALARVTALQKGERRSDSSPA